MKINILTQYYPPEHGAPQNRLHDLAKRLVEKGLDVTVLTAMPNYPKGEIFSDYKKKLVSRDELDGVEIIHSWIWTTKKKNMIPQLRMYFSFVFSSILTGVFLLKRSDFLICESPPLFIGFSALILKFFKRSKLIMNISDLWPESAVQLGMLKKGPALSCLEWFEKRLYKKSFFVSCQTEGIVSGVKKSCPTARTFLFPNGVDPEAFYPMPKSDKLLAELKIDSEDFIIGYGGNHGRSQALTQVLEAAEILKDRKLKFLFFGDGPEKVELMEKAKTMKLTNVKFYESRSRLEMGKIQALWDIALVPLRDIELFTGARPSKMFELMAGEIPFVFCGRGEGADLASESGCSVAVQPENPKELAGAILALFSGPKERLQEMGKKGKEYVLENFNRIKLAELFLKRLDE